MKDKERYKESRFVGYLHPTLVKKLKEYMDREAIINNNTRISKSAVLNRAVKALLENEQKRR